MVFELKSGAKLPHNKPFDVLVATPGAFMPAQESDARLDWSTFKIVVFDEVSECNARDVMIKVLEGLHRPYTRSIYICAAPTL